MNQHRFILKPYKGPADRKQCPGCNKKHCFSHYIDTETNNVLSDIAGRCDHEINCGYHYKPKDFFIDNPDAAAQYGSQDGTAADGSARTTQQDRREPKPLPSLHSAAMLEQSMKEPETNRLLQYLHARFTCGQVEQAINMYHIGTARHWPGATVFWQIAAGSGDIRAGKIMLYNPLTGKRVKQPFNHITWVHSALKLEDFNLSQCFFGEHLLSIFPDMPVAVVESEKTAIISSIYLPDILWLACGSLNNIKLSRCLPLAGRNVTLFPDLNGFDKWQEKAKALAVMCNINTSPLLENNATPEERESGLDLADFLIRIDPREIDKHRHAQPAQTQYTPAELSQPTMLQLRIAFMNEFLQGPELDEAGQRLAWAKYQELGLHPKDARRAVQDLIEQHHFTVE